MRKILIPLFVLIVLPSFALTQSKPANSLKYLWPTDASKYLTSVFGEYRARRFHTGIDVKTWGKTGYKIFAIRSGYILRVSVSPGGYGKALYLKLDTGETAVYAHLSKFSDKIQKLVAREQRRLGKYRVNLYLKKDQISVSQGDVVAYSGQTGIGAPHLHFEIRDANNVPLNPLSKGYQISDRVKPIVRRVSFSPLDVDSEVNGDFKPVVVTPQWIRSGEYVIKEPISIWGNVGIAVRCFDKGVSSFSGYGVYSLKLFVDDALRFEYSYDKLSFQKNRMVELERDYRLSRRQFGRFYKLYKDKFNTKSYYRPNKLWAGVLKSASLTARPELQSKSNSGSSRQNMAASSGSLYPGLHEFRIETADYMGNTSTIRGNVLVGAAFNIYPVIAEDENGQLSLRDVVTYDLKKIDQLEAFILNGNQWQPIPLSWSEDDSYLEEKGGEGNPDEAENFNSTVLVKNSSVKPIVLKIKARDEYKVKSRPFFYVHPQPIETAHAPQLTFSYDYYDDYLRLEISSKNLLGSKPEVILYPDRPNPVEVKIQQTDLKKFIGRIELSKLSGNFHLLKIVTESLNGEAFSKFEQFEARPVRPRKTDHITASDENFWVNFWSGSLYRTIYTRVVIDSSRFSKKYDFASHIYDVEPKDALLNQGAFVHIRIPPLQSNTEQLGVYYKDRRKGKWIFIDNSFDVNAGSMSAKILSFEQFALIRDSEPPEITRIRPGRNVHLKNRTPRISLNVRDALSGIKSEAEIEIRLNGRRLIAEYDPERARIFYDIKEPLAMGRYEISVRAEDNAQNVTTKTSVFWID